MSGWIIFTISMAIPGFAEFYAAWKLLFFVREKGGILPFLFCFLSGLFDLAFSAIMTVILVFGGTLVLELDYTNPLIFAICAFIVLSFFLWRLASATMSLWFAGLLQENTVRGLIRIYVRERRKDDREVIP